MRKPIKIIMPNHIKKILFIRRDNIGDLICTTPAIHAAREKYPDAKIGILVNTYNADAVRNNPDIDEVYVYEKAKHVPDKNKLAVWWSNLQVIRGIRKEGYDAAIGCGSYSPRLERYTGFTGAKTKIGYIKEGTRSKRYNKPLVDSGGHLHEVEKTFALLKPIGIDRDPSSMSIFPDPSEIERAKEFIDNSAMIKGAPLIAFHISSRRPENRWPVEKFIELGNLINHECGASAMLLWSPGSEKNVYHPGDDEKAEEIIRKMSPAPVAYRTTKLKELIAALNLADMVVCCDGGAMHIAAALGKPVVTMWGSTNAERWRPWGVKHVLLRGSDKKAENVSVEDVFNGVKELLAQSKTNV
ncbi:MAG: glycosyltransferase family 9 protein [Nitrospirae bacterium]|nr:glycosyltransferase family 9 protein [Nitrospirota bacterium]